MKLKTLEAEKAAAEKKAAGAAADMAEMRQRIADLESEAGATSGEVREKMRTTALELEEAKEKILGLETKEEELRSQVLIFKFTSCNILLYNISKGQLHRGMIKKAYGFTPSSRFFLILFSHCRGKVYLEISAINSKAVFRVFCFVFCCGLFDFSYVPFSYGTRFSF